MGILSRVLVWVVLVTTVSQASGYEARASTAQTSASIGPLTEPAAAGPGSNAVNQSSQSPGRGASAQFSLVTPAALLWHVVDRVSDGIRPPVALSARPSVNATGRFVAFVNAGADRVPHVFVRDRQTRTTELISVAVDGTPANGESGYPSISADGRFVAFVSGASNVVAADTNNAVDVFVRDRTAGTTERVSVASDGTEANNNAVREPPAISADGRFIAFATNATNLAPVQFATINLFVRDRLTGITELISGDGISVQPTISADGLLVAYVFTEVSPLGFLGHNCLQVFDRANSVRETLTGCLSPGSGGWGEPAISADGNFVAFTSPAPGFNGATGHQVAVVNRQSHAFEIVSQSATDGSGTEAVTPSMSADGRFVAFQFASATTGPDIFVRDRQTTGLELVSRTLDGSPSNQSQAPALSADGLALAFVSAASNLLAGDTNGLPDVFVAVQGTANQPPVARFTMTSSFQSATENQTLSLDVPAGANANVSFSAANSFDPDGSIASYEWRMSGSLVALSRDFTFGLGSGHHNILLTVTDTGGLTASVGGVVDVNGIPVALMTISSGSSTAKENGTLMLKAASGQTAPVSFSAADSVDPEALPLAYRWTISGSAVSSSQKFERALGIGEYQVLLTVSDSAAATATASASIVIVQAGTQGPRTVSSAPTRKVVYVAGMRLVEQPGTSRCQELRDYRVNSWTTFRELSAFFGANFLKVPDSPSDADLTARFNWGRDDIKLFNYSASGANGYTCQDTRRHLRDLSDSFNSQFSHWLDEEPRASFDVFAHSLGGVIVAYWAGGLNPDAASCRLAVAGHCDLEKLEAIHSFIAFSSPLRGLNPLLCTGAFWLGGDAVSDLCRPESVRQIARGLTLLHGFTVNDSTDLITAGAGLGMTASDGLLWASEQQDWQHCDYSLAAVTELVPEEVLAHLDTLVAIGLIPLGSLTLAAVTDLVAPHQDGLCLAAKQVRDLVKRALMNDFFDARAQGDPLNEGWLSRGVSPGIVCSDLWAARSDGVGGNADKPIQGTLLQSTTGAARCALSASDDGDAEVTAIIWHTWEFLVAGTAEVLLDGERRCEYGCLVPLLSGLVPVRDQFAYPVGVDSCMHRFIVIRFMGGVTVDGLEVVRGHPPGASRCP